MADISEQMLFDYFEECNKRQTLDDLMERFENVPLTHILKAANNLVTKRLLDEVHNHPGEAAWVLSEKAKTLIKEDKENKQKAQERAELELEKTRTDLALAKKMLEDYPSTKSKANLGLVIAIIVAIVEFVRFLGFLSGKD